MFLPAQQIKLLLASYCMYELVRKISHVMMEAGNATVKDRE